MLKAFKEFALKGNVVDMAVGIMLGAAFNGVVKSIVDDLAMPPLGLITGNLDFSDHMLVLREGVPPSPYATVAAAKQAGAVVLGYGSFVNTVVSFLLISLVLFFMVRWINRLRRPAAPAESKTMPCPYCRSDIDKTAVRCPHCTSHLEEKAAA